MHIFDSLNNDGLFEKSSLPALSHFFGLEETSKTQIGTFERLYEDSYQIEVGVPMSFGFNDVDFSPLVNPLGAVIETELSASLYTMLLPYLKQRLLKIQGNTDKPIMLPDPAECTIGNMLFFLKDSRFECKRCLEEYGINDTKMFVHHLTLIKDSRNDSAHRDTINKEQFLDFYQHFSVFYETYMPILIRMKLLVCGKSK